MSDDPEQATEATRMRRTIARIADALGSPVSTFYDSDPDRDAIDGLAPVNEAAVLTFVRAYLRGADTEARRRFVAAVRTMADEEPRSA